MKVALGIDYNRLEYGQLSFDYEGLMREVPYSFDTVREIQLDLSLIHI